MITSFAELKLEVEIAAGELFKIGDFTVTNAVATGAVGFMITLGILLYVGFMVKHKKYNRFVGLVQWVFEGLLNQINEVISDKKMARKITPLACTIFFLILFNYWLSVLPGLDTIRIGGVPLMRSPTADMNFVFGLSIVSVITVQLYAIKTLGASGNIGRYLRNPFKDPVGAFEGILELVGEFSRCASLALRLFGNAFAGEILLIVILLLSSFLSVAALPIFMLFELMIGFIQAYVFFILTLIFTALATSHGDSHSTHHEHSHSVTSHATAQPE